jgi:hypothetical protein
MPSGRDQQFALDLPENPCREIGGCPMIHRDNNRPAQRACEKSRDPLSTILAPKHDAVAFTDCARLQFPGEAKSPFHDLAIGPPLHPVPVPLSICALITVRLEVCQEEFC